LTQTEGLDLYVAIGPRKPGRAQAFPPLDLNALLDLGRFLEQHTEPGLMLGPDGQQVPLPEEARPERRMTVAGVDFR
jgi:hypothetical protein